MSELSIPEPLRGRLPATMSHVLMARLDSPTAVVIGPGERLRNGVLNYQRAERRGNDGQYDFCVTIHETVLADICGYLCSYMKEKCVSLEGSISWDGTCSGEAGFAG